MKYTIITPCRNSESYIEETAHSVLSQEGDFSLQYIIIDGDSADGTVALAKACGAQYSSSAIDFQIISEPDSGMYDALSKGFTHAKGDFIGYLNASDLLHPNSLDRVAKVLRLHPGIRWLTGRRSWCSEDGSVFPSALPFRYRSSLIKRFFYGRKVPHIPQESTLWHRDLLGLLNLERLREFQAAGDYYMWKCFSAEEHLTVVDTEIGCFRVHSDQISQSNLYDVEAHSIADQHDSFSMREWLHVRIWNSPELIRRLIGKPVELPVDDVQGRVRPGPSLP